MVGRPPSSTLPPEGYYGGRLTGEYIKRQRSAYIILMVPRYNAAHVVQGKLDP